MNSSKGWMPRKDAGSKRKKLNIIAWKAWVFSSNQPPLDGCEVNMGEYLTRCFPMHSTYEEALASAIEQIKSSRQGKPQNIEASRKMREATNVWQSNLAMSKFFPPLPDHIEQQRIAEDRMRYARYIAKGIAVDNYGYGEGKNMGD